MAKVGKVRPKSKDCTGCLTSAILPNMKVLAQVIGVLEPENRKVGQGVFTFFAKVKVTFSICLVRPFELCTVNDNVAVAALVSNICTFKVFFFKCVS